ncbi:MAG: mismatch-specific DNA-glycosylase, partial [Actinomycetota bacterium]
MSPTKAELLAAHGRTVPDVLAPDLDVVFVGINPGLWSGAVGHHFARPGNRFWKALHGSGFTDRLLSPSEEAELLGSGVGLTNLVTRATATAEEI